MISTLAAAVALGAALGASAQSDKAPAPQGAPGWYERGMVKRDLGDCRSAIADFSRALEFEPAYFNALYQRGRCRQVLGDDSGAIEDLTRAAKVPGQIHARVLAYFARAQVFRRMGRLEEAHVDYTQVLALRTDTTARRYRAWVNLYRGRLTEAADDFTRYMQDTEGKESDAPYATIAAVLALRRLGRRDEAEKLLRRWEPQLDAKRWPAPVLEFLRGKLTEDRLIASASGAGQKTEALAYAGVAALAGGASEHGFRLLSRVLREGDPAYLEYDLAYHELRRAGRVTPADRKQRKTGLE